LAALLAIGVAALAPVPAARAAATITIINADAPGEGFNDPTPAAPVGGNTGTTIGQQRLIVFQTAANIWGAILDSPVTIRVQANFDALSCTANSAVLGSAGPTEVFRDFTGAEYTGSWYHKALADKRAGSDLDAASPDIAAHFNSNLGQSGCLTGLFFYYGLDGNEGTQVELLPVVIHELGHGLGFSTTTSGANGSELGGFPSVYDRYLYDKTTGKHWIEMSNAERATSALNTRNLVWDGPAVRQQAPLFLGARPSLIVTAPASIAGSYFVGTAAFGPPLTTGGVEGDVVLADDGVAPGSDVCSALVNGGAMAGRIAFIDRGTCAFTSKVVAAQNAGAIGVIIADNVAGSIPPGLGGTDGSIVIPTVSVTQSDGNLIRAQLATGVHARLVLDSAALAGADEQHRVLIYAPNPYEAGSSVSHWDVSATPNLLMEPAINVDLHTSVDLTKPAFEDIGWFPHVTAVQQPGPGPIVATLGNNSPNPFGGQTTVSFSLPAAAPVSLGIYDLAGRLVRRLAEGTYSAGQHAVTWDGTDTGGRRVAAGVYFYRLNAADRTISKTMVLFK
jgi:hypothetical protein